VLLWSLFILQATNTFTAVGDILLFHNLRIYTIHSVTKHNIDIINAATSSQCELTKWFVHLLSGQPPCWSNFWPLEINVYTCISNCYNVAAILNKRIIDYQCSPFTYCYNEDSRYTTGDTFNTKISKRKFRERGEARIAYPQWKGYPPNCGHQLLGPRNSYTGSETNTIHRSENLKYLYNRIFRALNR